MYWDYLYLHKYWASTGIVCFDFIQSNAQRAQSQRWRDKICSGKMGDGGYAPVLLSIILLLMFLFINSVIAGKIICFNFPSIVMEVCSFVNHDCLITVVLAPSLPKVTAVVGLWAWTALSLAAVSLIMFYRCSR